MNPFKGLCQMLKLEQQNALREKYREMRPEWQPATELYADLCRTYLQKDAKVLDLGCGRGGLFEQLDREKFKLIGLDMDMDSLLNHRLAELDRVLASGDTLPFANKRFDLVVSSWLLEHLNWPVRTFVQVGRILKPGGVFIFITPNGRHPLAILNRIFGRMASIQGRLVYRVYGRAPEDTFPTRYLANSPDSLNYLAIAASLEIVALYTVADPTYLAISPHLFTYARLVEENLPTSRHTHLVGVMRRAKDITE